MTSVSAKISVATSISATITQPSDISVSLVSSGPQGPTGDTGPAGITDYNNLSNKPSIPSVTSDLTNDSGFITDISAKADITYVDSEVAGIVDSSPATLNTLNELAAALGDDPNFATTMITLIGTKVPLTGGTMTGLLEINNPSTTTTDIIFKASSGIANVTTELFARGTQRWDFTDGSSVYKGSIQYSTPGGNPGILMRGATELGRTDIGMHSQTGGFSIGTTTTNNNPPTQFLVETDNNVSVPLGDFTVTVGNIIVGGTVDGIDIATDVGLNTAYRGVGHLPLAGGTVTGTITAGGYNSDGNIALNGADVAITVYDTLQNASISVGRNANERLKMTANDTNIVFQMIQDLDEGGAHYMNWDTTGSQDHDLDHFRWKIDGTIEMDFDRVSGLDLKNNNLTTTGNIVVGGTVDGIDIANDLIPYSGATGDVDLGTNKLTVKRVEVYNQATHGELYVGNSNSTPSDNLGGYLYIGKFGAPQGSGSSVGAIYFESKTTDSMTHVAGVQANIVQGNTTRSLTTGNLDFTTKGSGMDDPRSRLRIDENGNIGFGGTITDFSFTGADIVLKNGNLGIGVITAATKLHVNGAITQNELSADPSDPAEGQSVIWQSDGTGSGDDGDIIMKITAGATTKTVTLVDFSAV